MTPEARLAVYAVVLEALALALVLAATITAGLDHRRQT